MKKNSSNRLPSPSAKLAAAAVASGIVQWRTAPETVHTEPIGSALLDRELYLAEPSRTSNRYPHKRSYIGLHYVASAGLHVAHESLLEANALAWLDMMGGIVAIAAQPMKIHFADGSVHFPDFLALHDNNRQVLYDVKPADWSPKVDAQFAKTRAVCERIGWGYEVYAGHSPQVKVNLEFISAFNHHGYHPGMGQAVRLQEVLVNPTPFDTAAAALDLPLPGSSSRHPPSPLGARSAPRPHDQNHRPDPHRKERKVKTLDTTDTVQLEDGDYLFLETAANIVRLRRMRDSQVVDLTTAEFARRVVGPAPALPKPLHRYTDIADSQRTLAEAWTLHLEELTTGVHPFTGECRPEYDLDSRTLKQRVESKVVEMQRQGMKSSRSTAMRKLADYRGSGVVGVIDGRALRNRNTLGNLHPDVVDALTAAITRQVPRSTGTVSRIIVETKADLLKRFGAEHTARILPSNSTFYTHIANLTLGKFTTGSAKTRRSTANQPQRTMTTQTEYLPGAQLQIDSTTMDILVRPEDPKGKPERPVLTIMIDVATRSLVAYTIRLTAAKVIDHATLLAQALTPHANRPDRDEYRQWVQDQNPQCTLATPAERSEYERHRPYIHPRRIMTDNGKDFLSQVFLSAARQFGVSITQSAPHTPTDKAIVERMFGTINTMFAQFLPGYVGRSPEHRGENVAGEDLLNVHGLFELFDDWVVRDWQTRPHSSLRDRTNPHVLLSPNQKFFASSEITSNMYTPLTENDYINLLPTAHAVISSTGVRVHGLQYDADELHPLRGTRSSLKKLKGKWAIKYDPYNRQSVWVAGPAEEWIKCSLREAARLLAPIGFLTAPHPAEPTERDQFAHTMAQRQGTPMHQAHVSPTEHNLIHDLADEGLIAIPDYSEEETDYVD